MWSLPIAVYYALRAGGASAYLALVLGAVAPGIRNARATLVKTRTIDRLGALMLSSMLRQALSRRFQPKPTQALHSLIRP